MHYKFIIKQSLSFLLPILTVLILAGCSSGGGYQFQSPIKPAPPPPIVKQQSFTVAPNEAKAVPISVNSGDRLTGSFAIEGGRGNDVNFYVKDALGNLILDGGRVSNNWQFDFVCASSGSYQLNFDNGFSIISNKAINLKIILYPSQ